MSAGSRFEDFFCPNRKKLKSSMKVIMINGIEVIGRQRLMKANFRERKNKMARFILGASLLYPADPATNFIKFFTSAVRYSKIAAE